MPTSQQLRWDSWARLTEPLLSRVPALVVGGNHEVERLANGATFTSYNARYPSPQVQAQLYLRAFLCLPALRRGLRLLPACLPPTSLSQCLPCRHLHAGPWRNRHRCQQRLTLPQRLQLQAVRQPVWV